MTNREGPELPEEGRQNLERGLFRDRDSTRLPAISIFGDLTRQVLTTSYPWIVSSHRTWPMVSR